MDSISQQVIKLYWSPQVTPALVENWNKVADRVLGVSAKEQASVLQILKKRVTRMDTNNKTGISQEYHAFLCDKLFDLCARHAKAIDQGFMEELIRNAQGFHLKVPEKENINRLVDRLLGSKVVALPGKSILLSLHHRMKNTDFTMAFQPELDTWRELAGILLRHGANVNEEDQGSGMSTLMHVVGKQWFVKNLTSGRVSNRGLHAIIQWLVNQGADINQRNREGNTPLAISIMVFYLSSSSPFPFHLSPGQEINSELIPFLFDLGAMMVLAEEEGSQSKEDEWCSISTYKIIYPGEEEKKE